MAEAPPPSPSLAASTGSGKAKATSAAKPAKPKQAAPAKAPAAPAKRSEPVFGDMFRSSHGFDGKDMVSLVDAPHIPADGGEVQVRLMKNLLFMPTHHSYCKPGAATNGKFCTGDEYDAEWYILPVVVRDSTKFKRPVVMALRINHDKKECRVVYIVYGNTECNQSDRDPGIIYTLDDAHGVALSSHILKLPIDKVNTVLKNKLDYQARYCVFALKWLCNRYGTRADHKDVKSPSYTELLPILQRAKEGKYQLGASLLVLDKLRPEEKDCMKSWTSANGGQLEGLVAKARSAFHV